MYYALIALSSLMFSAQFLLNENYQKENGVSASSALKLSLYSSMFGLLIMLVINRFSLHFSAFSLILAVIYAIVCITMNFCTVKVFEFAGLTVFSVFSMIGGMALPFLYGIICGEELKPIRIICFVLVFLSIILMIGREKASKKAFPYYIGVFILNGSVGVISSFHQSKTELCVDSASFLMLSKICTIAICIIFVLIKKDFKISKASVFRCGGIAGLNSIGNLFILFSLLHLPTSVQYPMITGGTIVFATAIDLVRKVKVTKRELISAAIALVATCFMAL